MTTPHCAIAVATTLPQSPTGIIVASGHRSLSAGGNGGYLLAGYKPG
jgi:hypothetical protein